MPDRALLVRLCGGFSLLYDGVKARTGLMRAMGAHLGWAADAKHWAGSVSKDYRMLLLGEGKEQTRKVVDEAGKRVEKVVRKGLDPALAEAEMKGLIGCRDVALGQVVRCRIRYFRDGAVLGSRQFVDEIFNACREQFGTRRKDGARTPRGAAAPGPRACSGPRGICGGGCEGAGDVLTLEASLPARFRLETAVGSSSNAQPCFASCCFRMVFPSGGV